MKAAKISPDFPCKMNYIDVHGSPIYYVDEGEGDPMLFLHGNPTSCYIWRNIIPGLSANARCIAMDLIGMGRSGKPDIRYRFVDHMKYVDGFIEKMGLENITLVLHDWGSALGFSYAMRHESNVKGMAFMEAILKEFSWSEFPRDFRTGFRLFRTPLIGWFMIAVMNVFVEQVMPRAVVRGLTGEELDCYREPFMNVRDRRPVWRWPNEIPIEGHPPDVSAVVRDINSWLQKTDIPKLLFHADPGGIINTEMVKWCRTHLNDLTTVDIGPGIHYLQEDNPELIGKELAKWHAVI